MTKQQRRAVRRGLRQYGDALWSGDKAGAGMEWAGVVAKVMDYYARADPVCGELLRLRYLERWREDKTFPAQKNLKHCPRWAFMRRLRGCWMMCGTSGRCQTAGGVADLGMIAGGCVNISA